MGKYEFPFKLPLFLDGATGSNLIRQGLPNGECVEKWILDNPEIIKKLHGEYINAGSDIIYAPTFSANSEKLAAYGLEGKTAQYNFLLTQLSKETAAGKALVAGDLSPTGRFVLPFGDMDFFEMFFVYLQQAEALKTAGADLLVIETMHSLSEARAAVLACVRQNLPVFVTISVDENGRTLTGATALTSLICLQELGISAFGLNCSTGPETMKSVFDEIIPYAKIPLIAKPNAGLPDEEGNYSLSPEEMAKAFIPLLEKGVKIIGGCCGSDSRHITALRKLLDGFDFKDSDKAINKDNDQNFILSNESEIFFLAPDNVEISDYLHCSVDMSDELIELSDSGVDVIAVELLNYDDAILFSQNAHMAKLPIMFRSDSKLTLETALILYNGRAAIDSKSEIDREDLVHLADKYGAIIY